jgi:hypothetical protein
MFYQVRKRREEAAAKKLQAETDAVAQEAAAEAKKEADKKAANTKVIKVRRGARLYVMFDA